MLINESDHGILWLFVMGGLLLCGIRLQGEGFMGGLFVICLSSRCSSRLPAFFMPLNRQIHLLGLQLCPFKALGLTQAALAPKEHAAELWILIFPSNSPSKLSIVCLN